MKKQKDVSRYDKNMAVRQPDESGVVWYGPDELPFELEGFPFRKKGGAFRRFPSSKKSDPLPEAVDFLAWQTSGGMIRFKTDSKRIFVRAELDHISRMDHMAYVGSMGFDLYVGGPFAKRLKGVTRISTDPGADSYTCQVFQDATSRMREFTLHFPLYSGVSTLQIGLEEDVTIISPTAWRDPRPIVVYGSSITQGGCASRPGMSYTNLLSRMLNRPVLNFGFSGSGKGEPSVARVLASLRNPAMFLLDYDGNAKASGLEKTLETFYDILRAAHPSTPVLALSMSPLGWDASPDSEGNLWAKPFRDMARLHTDHLERREASGDRNLHFYDGTNLYGPASLDATVDGGHGTDLGFYMAAQNLYPVITRILDDSGVSV